MAILVPKSGPGEPSWSEATNWIIGLVGMAEGSRLELGCEEGMSLELGCADGKSVGCHEGVWVVVGSELGTGELDGKLDGVVDTLGRPLGGTVGVRDGVIEVLGEPEGDVSSSTMLFLVFFFLLFPPPFKIRCNFVPSSVALLCVLTWAVS